MISHGTAAAFWGLRDDEPALIDVTGGRQAGRKVDGIRCRRCRYPRPEEIVTREGVACTTPARTLVDLAGMLGTPSLRRAVERAAVLKLLNLGALDRAIRHASGRRGIKTLRLILEDWRTEDGSVADVRSDFEALVLPRLVARGLPRPICNKTLWIDDHRLTPDFLWEKLRVVVETDGEGSHGTPVAFQRDRQTRSDPRRRRLSRRREPPGVRFTTNSTTLLPGSAALSSIAAAGSVLPRRSHRDRGSLVTYFVSKGTAETYRGLLGALAVGDRGRDLGADLGQEAGRELAGVLVGAGLAAGGVEEADASLGRRGKPVRSEVPSIATRVTCASGTSRARRPTPLRARRTSPRERVPSGKTPMQTPRPQRLDRPRQRLLVALAALDRDLAHAVEDRGQAAHLPEVRFGQGADLAALAGGDPDHDRVPVAVVVAEDQQRAALGERRRGPRPAAAPQAATGRFRAIATP